MIGLKRGTVELLPYNSQYKVIANNTISLLKTIFNDKQIKIEHIGSTAIPSISSKPIIDLIIGLENIVNINKYLKILEENNIFLRESKQKNQLLLVMGEIKNQFITHHIHVLKYQCNEWNDYILFRDYLNTHLDKAKEYNDIKLKLKEKYFNNREEYTKAKNQIINKLLNEAKMIKQ